MQEKLVVGGIYSVESGDGRFGVVKILALDPGIVHARLYKNKYDTRPTNIDPAILSVGTIFEAEFGIGHTPLSLEGFMRWEPVLLMKTSVTEDELDGYNIWKDSAGGGPAGSSKETMWGVVARIVNMVRRTRPN